LFLSDESGIPPGCNPLLTLPGGRSLGCLGTTTGYHLASLRDATHFCALPENDIGSKKTGVEDYHPLLIAPQARGL